VVHLPLLLYTYFNAIECNKFSEKHKYFPLSLSNQIPLYHRDFCVAKKINQMPSVWSDYWWLHPPDGPTLTLSTPTIRYRPSVVRRRKVHVRLEPSATHMHQWRILYIIYIIYTYNNVEEVLHSIKFMDERECFYDKTGFMEHTNVRLSPKIKKKKITFLCN
jgi:hypothetical protein